MPKVKLGVIIIFVNGSSFAIYSCFNCFRVKTVGGKVRYGGCTVLPWISPEGDEFSPYRTGCSLQQKSTFNGMALINYEVTVRQKLNCSAFVSLIFCTKAKNYVNKEIYLQSSNYIKKHKSKHKTQEIWQCISEILATWHTRAYCGFVPDTVTMPKSYFKHSCWPLRISSGPVLK